MMVTAYRKTDGQLIKQWRLAGALHPREWVHQSRTPWGEGVYKNGGGNQEIGGIARDFCAGSHVIPAVIR